jgi:cellulose 1,4-beta-cellobiosidase
MGRSLLLLACAGTAAAQLIGHGREEVHLSMPIQHCTMASGSPSCKFLNTTAVLDSNWRWLHKEGCSNSSVCNCYLGNVWVNATCSSVKECTNICALDGEDEEGYKEKYGIAVDGQGAMNMTFVTNYKTTSGNGTNVGSRMYLLEDEHNYKMFNLLNKEFTFTVDGSDLPCGLNGAIYFVEMEKDGGVKSYPTNKAGAKYGTGYCDAQCPHDLKWIAGEANMIGWNGSKTDPNVGHGKYGTCCAELDIWEANKISTQMTVHSCDKPGYYKCEGIECGDNNGKNASDPGDRFKGICDKNGCDFNPYREGDHLFFGPGPQFKIDSTKPVQVVTQFITTDGTDTGDLKEMRRFYIQGNKTIHNPSPSYGPGPAGEKYDALSDDTCKVQMANFTDRWDVFHAKGGIAGMGKAMGRGLSLVFSLWDDHDVGMKWLDAIDPYPIPAGKSGALRGTCNQTEGNYDVVEKKHPDSTVIYSDVRYGDIGSTYGPGAPPPPPPCPGGSLAQCLALCAAGPPPDFPACEKNCYAHCLDFSDERFYVAQ